MNKREVLARLSSPPGAWEVFADEVSIVGERFRMQDCCDFIEGAAKAVEKRDPFGVRLVREPDNPHDKLAIKVLGFWTARGWFSSSLHERHIGYVPGKLAYKIDVHIGPDAPLGAELLDFEMDDGEPNVVINILEAT